jgi:CheY-like chemotaxis protein
VTDEDVYCDKLRLNQVLLNLVSNAMKFTKPGGSVFISIRQIGKKPGDRAASYEFHVRDTGIGMSKEFAEHIFEPFTRENTSTVSGIQGTGLGMSIAKSIVDMMGGTITVNTEAGKGTEFCVALRFRLQSAHRTIEKIKELEGQRVLVIDDDLNSCQSVAGMLHQLGLEAEWTVYGEDGVDRTKKAVEAGNPYRIYIVDWKMADMNGIETARQIRQIVGKDAPIIMLSAYDWADIEAQAQDVGVTCFVRKPLFISELYHVLMKACGYLEETEPEEEGGKEEIFKGKRVLLAEDNVLNTEIAVELLTETGLEVETAENGKVACEMLAASRPGYYDLILMDIQMPIMDGYEATRQIRSLKDPVLSRIPIIAMTANAFEEDRKKAESCGVNGYVAKPIEVDKLFDAIGKIVL